MIHRRSSWESGRLPMDGSCLPPSSLHSAPYPSPKSQSCTPDLLSLPHTIGNDEHLERMLPVLAHVEIHVHHGKIQAFCCLYRQIRNSEEAHNDIRRFSSIPISDANIILNEPRVPRGYTCTLIMLYLGELSASGGDRVLDMENDLQGCSTIQICHVTGRTFVPSSTTITTSGKAR